MDIIQQIRERASMLQAHVVLPEATDNRVVEAANYLADNQICTATVLSVGRDIKGVSEQVSVIDISHSSLKKELSAHLHSRRKAKGWSLEDAQKALDNPLYFGACMIAKGYADGCVAGSVATTGDVIRAAIHSIGLKSDSSIVSSIFLMAMPNGKVFTYGDCGVVPYPDANQLADIAIESSRTHRLLTEQEPVTAMLSFSTKGSARHDKTELVTDALTLVGEKDSYEPRARHCFRPPVDKKRGKTLPPLNQTSSDIKNEEQD